MGTKLHQGLDSPRVVQPNHINMAVLFLYLITMLTLLYSSVHCTSHVLQGTINTRPCMTGHPVDNENIQPCGSEFGIAYLDEAAVGEYLDRGV